MLRVFYNIETLPERGTNWTSFLDQVEIGNRTVQSTIDAWKAKRAPELYAATSTDPFRASMFVASFLVEDDVVPLILIDEHEASLFKQVEETHQTLVGSSPSNARVQWHTWNGINFDHPLTLMRALKYKCPLTFREHQTAKWGDAHHVDWFLKLGIRTEGGRPRGKLDEVSGFLGIHHPNPFPGSEIHRAWEARDVEGIRLHTASRVLLLRDIANRVGSVELPKESA